MYSELEKAGIVAITLQELRQITDGFSEKRLIGMGGFGRVYKVRSCMHGFEP